MSRGPSNWSAEELDLLAKAEGKLITSAEIRKTRVNQQLEGAVAGRTVQAIKGVRRTQRYKQRVEHWVEKLTQDKREERTRTITPERAGDGPLVEERLARETILESVFSNRYTGPVCFGSRILNEGLDKLERDWKDKDSHVLRSELIDLIDRHADHLLSGGDSLSNQRGSRPPRRKHTGPSTRPQVRPPPLLAQGRRETRRLQYKSLQALYSKDRKRAAESVLTGDWRLLGTPLPTIEEGAILNTWRGIFESDPILDIRPVREVRSELWDLAKGVTTEEVKITLKSTSESSPGSDGLVLRVLKACPPVLLSATFNLWLAAEYLPRGYRKSRTVLIPKVHNPLPDERRPLTITSYLVRLLHKTLAMKISRLCPVSERQKAFMPVDGCAENLSILGMVLNQAHTCQSDVLAAFLDLAKAFDSVSWSTVERCMRRAGIPGPLRRYILSSYYDSETVLFAEGKELGTVKLNKGVKQGDPLSPLLFNLVVDELVAELEYSPCGVRIKGQKVSVMAFADDLVLTATTPAGLQELIGRAEEVLGAGGLLMNPGKCRALTLKVDKKAKKWCVSTGTTLSVGGRDMPHLQAQDSVKYLGVLVGPGGKRESYGSLLETGLRQLKAAPLKPQQRVYILRQHLVPGLLHRLVLGKVYRTQLDRMDRTIRCAVRSYLSMPHDAADALLYAQTRVGGLGIPHLGSSVQLMKTARLTKLLESTDPLVRLSTTEGDWIRDQRYWSAPPKIRGKEVKDATEVSRRWLELLGQTVDGSGIVTQIHESQSEHRWVTAGSGLLTGSEYIKAIGVRSATIKTPLRAARGRDQAPKDCWRCNLPASLGHISQSCPINHGFWIKRHDNVARYISGRLKQRDRTVMWEPKIPFGGSYCKPDLVTWDRARGVASVAEVAVASDSFPLNRTYELKRSKYSPPEILDHVRAMTDCQQVEVIPAVLSWRGCWSGPSSAALKRMGLTESDLEVMAVKVLSYTGNMVSNWYKDGCGSPNRRH